MALNSELNISRLEGLPENPDRIHSVDARGRYASSTLGMREGEGLDPSLNTGYYSNSALDNQQKGNKYLNLIDFDIGDYEQTDLNEKQQNKRCFKEKMRNLETDPKVLDRGKTLEVGVCKQQGSLLRSNEVKQWIAESPQIENSFSSKTFERIDQNSAVIILNEQLKLIPMNDGTNPFLLFKFLCSLTEIIENDIYPLNVFLFVSCSNSYYGSVEYFNS